MSDTNRKVEVSRPELLNARHEISTFESNEPALDDWLKRRALKSQKSGAARSYVATAESLLVGYCWRPSAR